MYKVSENKKHKPNSLISFGNKRIGEINALAQTKFGTALIKVSVNREEECFDIFLQDPNAEHVTDFETMWTMCKVHVLTAKKKK